MNFLSKKVPISLVIASIFITAAVTFPISYNLALNKINKIVILTTCGKMNSN